MGATSRHEVLDRLGRPEVGELEHESLHAAVHLGRELARDFVGGSRDHAAPGSEATVRGRDHVVTRRGVEREPDRVLGRDARVARERPELVDAVERVAGAVPPVGEPLHERHRELGPAAADVHRERATAPEPAGRSRAAA